MSTSHAFIENMQKRVVFAIFIAILWEMRLRYVELNKQLICFHSEDMVWSLIMSLHGWASGCRTYDRILKLIWRFCFGMCMWDIILLKLLRKFGVEYGSFFYLFIKTWMSKVRTINNTTVWLRTLSFFKCLLFNSGTIHPKHFIQPLIYVGAMNLFQENHF